MQKEQEHRSKVDREWDEVSSTLLKYSQTVNTLKYFYITALLYSVIPQIFLHFCMKKKEIVWCYWFVQGKWRRLCFKLTTVITIIILSDIWIIQSKSCYQLQGNPTSNHFPTKHFQVNGSIINNTHIPSFYKLMFCSSTVKHGCIIRPGS